MNPNCNTQFSKNTSNTAMIANSANPNLSNYQNNYGMANNNFQCHSEMNSDYSNSNKINLNIFSNQGSLNQFSQGQLQGQMQENSYTLSLSQIIKNNIENNLFKIPEKCSSLLMEKLKPQFQSNEQMFGECKKQIKLTEESFEVMIDNIKNNVEQIEKTILYLENATNILFDNHDKNQILVNNFFTNNEEFKAETILKERQQEQIVGKFINDVEMMKFQVKVNINIIENDIKENCNLEDDALVEVNNLIAEKLNEVGKEITKINLEKRVLDKANPNIKKVDLSGSVKKLIEVKNHFQKIKNNKNNNFIFKDNFSFLGKENKNSLNILLNNKNNFENELNLNNQEDKNICSSNNENLKINNLLNKNNIFVNKKKKSVDYSFY